MYIYLAHPIDFAGEHRERIDALAWEARNELIAAGVRAIYTPALAWTVDAGRMYSAVQNINTEALKQANGLLAIYPEDTKSVGVPMEIGMAHAWGIPTAVVRGRLLADTERIINTSAVFATFETRIFPESHIHVACQHLLNAAVIGERLWT